MRKKLLSLLLVLILLLSPAFPVMAAGDAGSSPTILIAYFSWAGHTKQIAEEIHAQVGGDMFEIQPEIPYTDNINELSGIALQEQRDNVRPPLSTHVADMDQYDYVFIGYPCWWSNMPMPVFTFLEEYSFTGKTVIPFTSYGENVFGRSLDSIREILPDATMAEGLAIQEHTMQDMPEKVTAWLQSLGIKNGVESGGNTSNVGDETNSGNGSDNNTPNVGDETNSSNDSNKENNTAVDDKLKPEPTVDFSCTAGITLSRASYVYDGKKKNPGVTVKVASEVLRRDTDYTVAYRNNTKVGTASVIITGMGRYTGTITKTFTIVPKGTSILGKIAAKESGFTVRWRKQAKSTTGYQIQYSTSRKFSKKTTVAKLVKKSSKTKINIRKLKAGKKYYVRVRSYKTVNQKKYYSNWSAVGSVMTKK